MNCLSYSFIRFCLVSVLCIIIELVIGVGGLGFRRVVFGGGGARRGVSTYVCLDSVGGD